MNIYKTNLQWFLCFQHKTSDRSAFSGNLSLSVCGFPEISTLGYKNNRLVPDDIVNEHIETDLNTLADMDLFFNREPFDLVILAETIEHLYVPPTKIFRFVNNKLKPGGGFVVRTPNAVSLNKRFQMLKGRNPYELLRDDKINPGHFREYIMREMIDYGEQSNFILRKKDYYNYWQTGSPVLRVLEKLTPQFRKGMTMLFRKQVNS